MPNGSKLKWVNTYLTRKPAEKQWKGIGEKDSIVPAEVQLNLHHPCAAACEQRAGGSIIVLSSNGNYLNLCAEQQELGKRQVPDGFHQLCPNFLVRVSPSYLQILHRFWVLVFYLDFSIFSIPQLFADSGCGIRFGNLIRKFIPKMRVQILLFVLVRGGAQNSTLRFGGVTSWKNFSIFLGDTIYILNGILIDVGAIRAKWFIKEHFVEIRFIKEYRRKSMRFVRQNVP